MIQQQEQEAREVTSYSLLVSNVGWVIRNNPDYEYVHDAYLDYTRSTSYSQVSMWASDEDDPIQEFEIAKEYPEGWPEKAGTGQKKSNDEEEEGRTG